jgi:RNA 3'-terminal phosphate cyclase
MYSFLDNESGPSSGFGLTLVAETTTDCMLSVEMMAPKGTLPEELAETCCKALLTEILRGAYSAIVFSHSAVLILFSLFSGLDCEL